MESAIGISNNPATLEAAANAICQILRAHDKGDASVGCAALQAFAQVAQVPQTVNISHCHIENHEAAPKRRHKKV